MNNKEMFMKEALKEAKKAYKKLEIPVRSSYCKRRRNNSKGTQFKRD